MPNQTVTTCLTVEPQDLGRLKAARPRIDRHHRCHLPEPPHVSQALPITVSDCTLLSGSLQRDSVQRQFCLRHHESSILQLASPNRLGTTCWTHCSSYSPPGLHYCSSHSGFSDPDLDLESRGVWAPPSSVGCSLGYGGFRARVNISRHPQASRSNAANYPQYRILLAP